ncbi:MAG: NAD-dependent protein deacylase [Clostridiales bacterium]|jgi:NAD-dependent deacetylase|nr:NAD-dependent protein deacylase [Clostridiales bacterium]
MREKIELLKEYIENSNNIVFFGGAGVSTESGIPDFRSAGGLYNENYKYPPERMLSHSFFMTNTGEFFDFYKTKMLFLGAKPNAAHLKLAELEREGKLTAVITQNVDNLHQMAGSKNVFELHGSVYRNFCMDCEKEHEIEDITASIGVARCECGGIIKPDVVLYEEGLDEKTVSGAIAAIENADVLIVGGTSLAVYPAAGLINYYKGNKLVLINKSETPMDDRANLVIHESIGEVLSMV